MKGFIVALMALIGLSSCTIDYSYEVTGTAKSVTVSYMSETGSVNQDVDVALPWKRSFTGNMGDPVSVSAQNGGTGTIEVKIVKEGTLFKSGSADGQFGVASAAGSL